MEGVSGSDSIGGENFYLKFTNFQMFDMHVDVMHLRESSSNKALDSSIECKKEGFSLSFVKYQVMCVS